MNIPHDRAADFAASLIETHRPLRSWRKVRDLYYPAVSFIVLNRIARTGGAWMPKDAKILRALGLVEAKAMLPGEARTRRKIAQMAKITKEQVLRK